MSDFRVECQMENRQMIRCLSEVCKLKALIPVIHTKTG